MKSRLSNMVVVAGLAFASMGAHAAIDWTWQLDGTPTGSALPGATSVVGYSASSNSAALVATDANTSMPNLNWYGGGYGICSSGDGTSTNCAMMYRDMPWIIMATRSRSSSVSPVR